MLQLRLDGQRSVAPDRQDSIRRATRQAAQLDYELGVPLRILYPKAQFSLSISYATALHDWVMRTLSEDDARRIGAELKRWSQRPVETRGRWGLCSILIVMLLVAAQRAPNPAAVIHGVATMFVVIQGSLHFMSMGLLRGSLGAGIGEAQDPINAVREPHRVSNFDMAMLWIMVALAARYFE